MKSGPLSKGYAAYAAGGQYSTLSSIWTRILCAGQVIDGDNRVEDEGQDG
jgi:hypothetical protein